MRYLFNDDKSSLLKRVCDINNIDESDLDISVFNETEKIDILDEFKDLLLSLKDKRFFIVGDYDCDGICATTIIKKLLDDLNISNNYYIPSRSKQGYGLNIEIVDNAIKNNFDVLLCVDNGVVAHEPLRYGKENGLKLLIIDHHEYDIKPDVDGFLHPNLFDKKYEDMCASGICALLSNYIRYDELSIVYGGLASMADMVKVLGYNRYLIKKMHELLNSKNYITISNLIQGKNATYENLQFEAIPKINAISRLEDNLNVNYMVKYLLNYNNEANQLINTINSINQKRKEETNLMFTLASRLTDTSKEIIVLKSDQFREGLCGLIANRLMNEYLKPVIILHEDEDILKGSARSPKAVNLYKYLIKIKDLFESFGGHDQAIGLSIRKDKYDDLIEYLENNRLVIDDYYKNVLVFDKNDIDLYLLDQIEKLKPFGSYFEMPLIGVYKPDVLSKTIIKKMYPKYVLSDKFEAISFKERKIKDDIEYMIGSIQLDNYYHNKVSMIIEELI